MGKTADRYLKRCPKCGSGKIYKRVRAKAWSAEANSKRNTIEKLEKLSKTYYCQKCRHAFDNPLILDEIVQDDIGNNLNKDIKE